MKRNKKQNIKLLALVLILLLGIGFAALAATLKINGTVNVSKASWDVHFENVSIIEGSVEANPAPTSNNIDTTEMTYTVNFSQPGDFFEFTTDIVNAGTIDAMIDTLTNKVYQSDGETETTLPPYLNTEIKYVDNEMLVKENQGIPHNTSIKIKVRVEFKKNIEISDLPSSGDTTLIFKFSSTFKQANENVRYNNFNKIYQKGDNELCIYSIEHTPAELCIEKQNYATSLQKLKNYFGFNEETWIKEEIDDGMSPIYESWTNPDDPTVTCSDYKNETDNKNYTTCTFIKNGKDGGISASTYENGKIRVAIYIESLDNNFTKFSMSLE